MHTNNTEKNLGRKSFVATYCRSKRSKQCPSSKQTSQGSSNVNTDSSTVHVMPKCMRASMHANR
eukprot:scaffold127399_cov23-Tisochrysis_lutea.AAC.1